MEDPYSVDISTLGRKELLAKLDLGPSSSLGTEKLRNLLSKNLQKDHLIHSYVDKLSLESLRKLYMVIFEKSGSRQYEKMRRALTNEMFKKFPKAPLGAIIWIVRNGKVPTETEFHLMLKKISEIPSVSELSKEMDDLNMSENFDESLSHEMLQESDNSLRNKRK